MSDSRKSRNCTVSLQQLFPQSVIAAGDDILVKSCSCQIRPTKSNYHVGHHLFITGTDAGSDPGSEAEAAIKLGATAILTDRLLPVAVPQCVVEDVEHSLRTNRARNQRQAINETTNRRRHRHSWKTTAALTSLQCLSVCAAKSHIGQH